MNSHKTETLQINMKFELNLQTFEAIIFSFKIKRNTWDYFNKKTIEQIKISKNNNTVSEKHFGFSDDFYFYTTE